MSVCTTVEVDERSAASVDAGDKDVIHIVGDIQHWLNRLGLKVPRSLCGVVLIADPDRPDLPADAPTCPRCVALNGGRS
jgi:hypothetical protein